MTGQSATIRIKGKDYDIRRSDIEMPARSAEPRRVNSYFVEVDGRRFPPKQLLRIVVGSDAEFDTGLAIRALRQIGFEIVQVESN